MKKRTSRRRIGNADVEPMTVQIILKRIDREWCPKLPTDPARRGCKVGLQMIDSVVRRKYEGRVSVMDRQGIENAMGLKCLDAASYYQKSSTAKELFDGGCMKAVKLFSNDLLLVGSVKF